MEIVEVLVRRQTKETVQWILFKTIEQPMQRLLAFRRRFVPPDVGYLLRNKLGEYIIFSRIVLPK